MTIPCFANKHSSNLGFKKKVSKLVNLIKNETEVYIVTEEGKENEDHDR